MPEEEVQPAAQEDESINKARALLRAGRTIEQVARDTGNARAEIGTEPASRHLQRASPSAGKRRLLHPSLSIVRRDSPLVKYAQCCDIGTGR